MDRKSRPGNYAGKEEQMAWNEGEGGAGWLLGLSKAHNRIPQTLTVRHVTPYGIVC